ncbi:MAG: hypothetical protein ACYC0H_08870 [Solirubrobacteraceae bacterium]
MVKRDTWLSVTPEPERELPAAVATLTRGRFAADREVQAERATIERLILTGSRRRWLRYLHGVVELIEQNAGSEDPDVQRARQRALAVISNHHNLLLGLPGSGARDTASERERLNDLIRQPNGVK